MSVKSCRRILFLTGPLLLLLAAVAPVTAQSGVPQVTFQARALQPGEVVSLTLEAEREVKRAEARVFGKVFPLSPTGNRKDWKGLVGIDLEAKSGKYRVVFEGLYRDGSPLRVEPLTWDVSPKTFPTRKITVEDKFVNPPAKELERIRTERERVSAILATVSPERHWEGEFSSPVPGAATSGFGKRSVINGQPRSPHTGTDFSASTGTPIRSPNSGVVVLADNLYYAGNAVIVDHGGGLYSYFAHLSEFGVQQGDTVKRSDIIGKVGATGRVTGPHLHWAVRLVETRVDPLSLMAATGSTSATSESDRVQK